MVDTLYEFDRFRRERIGEALADGDRQEDLERIRAYASFAHPREYVREFSFCGITRD